jgi:hypothetical protein
MENLDHKSKKSASKDLYKKAIERWEAVLTYLALPSEKSIQNVSPITRELFQDIGFNRSSKYTFIYLFIVQFNTLLANGEFEITSLGFQFLLLGRTEQIWTYLIYYFKFVEVHQTEEDLFRVLEFFFRLSLCVTVADSKFLR